MNAAAIRLAETDAAAGAALLEPFDEQSSLDVAAGRRRLFALLRRTQAGPAEGPDVGSAVLGAGALDLFVRPEFRAGGLGREAAGLLLERAGDGPLTAWSHEDHPAARALAARFGFAAVRTLLQLRLQGLDRFETPAARAPQRTGATPAARAPGRAGADLAVEEPRSGVSKPGIRVETFRPGADDAEWLALNARVFAWHPEQGGTTQEDLAQRMAEPWFRADDFLVAREGDGGGDAMVGYCWLKVEAPIGEIYVIGVAPEAAGRGLGRRLMDAGLARLRERGCTVAELYVEADNAAAVHLYRALGFADEKVHVQYARRS